MDICPLSEKNKSTQDILLKTGIDLSTIQQQILQNYMNDIKEDLDLKIFKSIYPGHSELKNEIYLYLTTKCKNITNKELKRFITYIDNSIQKGIKAEWMGPDMNVKDMFSLIKISLGLVLYQLKEVIKKYIILMVLRINIYKLKIVNP